jgi:hypothetical protein
MWWPWSKSRRELKDAQQQQAIAENRGREREKLIRRAEQHLREHDTFGERWTRALGGGR